MADTDLNIILRLKDELSKGVSSAQSSIVKFSDSVQKVGQSIESAGRQISRFGGDLSQMGGIITAGFTAVIIKASERSEDLRDDLRELKISGQSLADTIGNAVAPVFHKVVYAIQNLVSMFNNLNPLLRDQIIQWTAIGGVLASIAGTIIWTGGKLLDLSGNLIQVVGIAVKFLSLHPALLLISGAVALIAYNWESLKPIAVVITKQLVEGVKELWTQIKNIYDLIGPAFKWIKDQIKNAVTEIIPYLEKLIVYLNGIIVAGSLLPENLGGGENGYFAQLGEMSNAFSEFLENFQKNAKEKMILPEIVVKAPESSSYQKFFNGMKMGFSEVKVKMTDFYEYGRKIAEDLSNKFQETLGTTIYDVFKGKSTKDAIKEFGDYCLKIISEIIAKMLIAKAIDMYSGSKAGIGSLITSVVGGGGSSGGLTSLFGGGGTAAASTAGGGSAAGGTVAAGTAGAGGTAAASGTGAGTSGGASAGLGAAGIVAIVVAAIIAQHNLTKANDRVVDGQRTGDAFNGSYATEPWFAYASNKYGLSATAGERFDASIKNKDWVEAAKRAPAAMDYWADPGRSWGDAITEKINQKLFGADVAVKIDKALNPLKSVFGGDDTPSAIETAFKAIGSSLNKALEGDFSQLQQTAQGFGSIGQQLLNEGVFTKLGGDLQVLGGEIEKMANGTGSATEIVKSATESLQQHLKDTGGNVGELDMNLINVIRTFSGASFNAEEFAKSLGLTNEQMKSLGLTTAGVGQTASWASNSFAHAISLLQSQAAAARANGQYQTGTRYVPETGYAYLHKGEQVIRANEVANQNASSGGTVNINLTIQAVDGASVQRIIPHIVKSLENEINKNGSFRRVLLNV